MMRRMVAKNLLQSLQERVIDLLSEELRSFFSIEQITQEAWDFSPKQETSLAHQIDSLSPHDIETLEQIFSIRKGAIHFHPLQERHLQEHHSLLPSFLLSAIRPDEDLWQVTTLHLNDASQLPEKTIDRIIAQCPNLQELFIAGCAQISSETVEKWAKSTVTLLSSLDVSHTALNAESLFSLLAANPNLATLSLNHLPQTLTTPILEQLPSHTPASLRTLSLNDNPQLEPLAIVHYLQTLPTLEKLFLVDCPQFRSATLHHLDKDLPKLQTFHLGYLKKEDHEILYDFQIISFFVAEHLHLEQLSLNNLRFRVNDIIYGYASLPERRDVELQISLHKENILFPKGISSEKQEEKIEDIVNAYGDKNILLLFVK